MVWSSLRFRAWGIPAALTSFQLPQVTNRQLVMHFALKGSDGVEFTVAGETRGYGGDGHAIVLHGVVSGQHVSGVLWALL